MRILRVVPVETRKNHLFGLSNHEIVPHHGWKLNSLIIPL
jgi:hypothetical protein